MFDELRSSATPQTGLAGGTITAMSVPKPVPVLRYRTFPAMEALAELAADRQAFSGGPLP